MNKKALLSLALLCCLSAVAQAVPTVTAGNHILLPETPNQVITVLVSGGDDVPGLDLFLYVNGGVAPAPVITAVDIIGVGTIFNPNNVGQFDLGFPFTTPGLEPSALTTTAAGFVPAEGVLAFVTVDTTGVPGGDYSFSLTNPSLGPTDFATNPGSDALLIDGILVVGPEPASIVMGLFGAAGLGVVILRRRRR